MSSMNVGSPFGEENASPPPSYPKLAIACGLLTVFIGALGLAGLFFRISLFTSIFPGYISIAFPTAFLLIVLGTVLVVHMIRPLQGLLRTCCLFLLAGIAISMAIEFPLNLEGTHFFPEALFVSAADAFFAGPTSHMSPVTVALILPSAIALILLLYATDQPERQHRMRLLISSAGFCIALVSFTFAISYAYETPFLYDTQIIPIALTTAIALFFLGTGLVIAAGVTTAPLVYFTGTSTRAVLLRTFIPLIIGIILIQNFVSTFLFAAAVPDALFLGVTLVVFTLVTSMVSVKISGNVSESIDRAESAERMTREYLENLIHYANAPIITWNPAYRITEFNHAFEDLTGLSRDEVIGQSLDILFPDETRTPSMEKIRSTSAGEHWEIVEIPIRHVGGGVRTVLWNSANVNGPDGTIIATIAQGTDITERKTAEAAIEQERALYKDLVTSQPSGIYRLRIRPTDAWSENDWESRMASAYIIEMVSDHFCEITGISREEFIANPGTVPDRVHPEDKAGFARKNVEAIQTQTPFGWEGRMVKNGNIIWVHFESIPRPLENGDVLWTGILYDITERKQAEETLRESQIRLQMALDVGNAGVWEWNIKTNEVRFDPGFNRLLGYAPGELPTNLTEWMSYHNPEDVPVWMGKAEAYLRGDVPLYESEHRIRAKDGSWAWVFTRGRFINSPTLGPKTLFVGIAMNVTERKLAEATLLESSRRLQEAQEMAHLGFWSWDMKTGRVEWSSEVFKIFGLDAETFTPQIDSILALSPWPEDHKRDQDLIQRAIESHEPGSYEQRFLRPDKSTGYYYSTFQGRYDDAGNLLSIVGTVLDITGRKETEITLKENEAKYRELFENITAGFALHEIILNDLGKPVDYRFLIVNEAFEKMTGLKGADITNQRVLEVLPGIEPYWIETYGQVAITGKSLLFENYSKDLDKWFEVRVYSPKQGQFATIFTDITTRRAMEHQREVLIKELEQKNAELEQFTYTVSHDLKSPLITIKGFAGLVEDDVHKGDQVQLKKDILRIMSAADTMQALLSDLLELSKIGRIVGPQTRIGFGTLAHEAVNLLAVPIAERGVTVEISPDLPEVNVDPTRIREVLVNLIENAIKFLGNRPDPVIRIGMKMEGEMPVFFVQDNGIGIDSRYLERIFNLFEKLDVTTPGTGIGLTIVRRIIVFHGGNIWAESDGPGKGTTFRFTLPGVVGEGDGEE
jgi:PAS domain S-box-containing protein